MKKIYLSIFALLVTAGLMAQVNVTFSVDMSGVTVNPNGVYLAGGFNDPDENGADYPADYNAAYVNWSPSANEMTDVDMDMVFEITLSLNPAAYQFKFINNNDWAGQEIIPAECTVGNGNGNRFTVVGASTTTYHVCWSECAACGEKAVRFEVDMAPAGAINPEGVSAYLVGPNSFVTLWNNPAGGDLWKGVGQIGTANMIEYKFVNGIDVNGAFEIVPAECDNMAGNRELLTPDSVTVAPTVFWEACSWAAPVNVTLQVDMSEACVPPGEIMNLMGTMTDWGGGLAMTNVSGALWSVTVPVIPSAAFYEYKYRIGEGGWESLSNRTIVVSAGPDVVVDVVCFNSLTACSGSVFPPADVTFRLHPGTTPVLAGQSCWVIGDFTGWQGGALEMTGPDLNGIYQAIVPDFCPQGGAYKFVISEPFVSSPWAGEENADFSAIGGCGVDNGDFSDNRVFTRTSAADIVMCYTYQTCTTCITAVDENQIVSNLNVYPVPTEETLNITFNSGNAQKISLNMLNNIGQSVLIENLGTVAGNRTVTLDVASLAKGIYTLQISNGNNSQAVLVAVK